MVKQFDPELIDAFGEIHGAFRAIAEQLADAGIHESLRSTILRKPECINEK